MLTCEAFFETGLDGCVESQSGRGPAGPASSPVDRLPGHVL